MRNEYLLSATLIPLLAPAATVVADDLADPGDDRNGPLVILHDNGKPDLVNGYSNATSGVFGFRRTLLDDFVVPEHQTWSVERMHWYHVKGTPMAGGPPSGLLLMFRDDDGGIPGPVFLQANVTAIETIHTGRIVFSREEEESWATFEPVMLTAGHYWFEATIIQTENDFWLTASPIRHSECWVNYEDLGGFQSGTDQFGVASDINWSIEGTLDVDGPGACCLADGQCLMIDFDACNDAGGDYLGPDVECFQDLCPGACCLSDGQCFEMSFGACDDAGGLFQGPEVNCSPALCGSPNACCFSDGTCRYETDVFCAALGGLFAGPPTNCESFQCVGSSLCMSFDSSYSMAATVTLSELYEQPGLDLVGVIFGADSIRWRRNDGNGGFLSAITRNTADGPVAIAMGDLDGDLDPDAAVAAKVGRVVAIHYNYGNGLGQPHFEYPAGLEPVDVAIGDLDGDLDNDLAVADRTGNRVLFMPNDGNAVFDSFVGFATDAPTSVAIGDFDGDLDNDLVVTNVSSNTVSVLFNDGTGAFGTPIPYATAASPVDVVAHDFDDDDDLDLAVVGQLDNQVSVFMNNGDGTFAGDVRYDAGNVPTAIAVIGADGDGTPDLAVANGGDRNVTVLVNNGAGLFGGRATYDAGDLTRDVAAGDLDADGDVDLVIANDGEDVRVYFNDCSGCPGDLDFSGSVDFGDILRILGAWGMKGGPEDLDGSGFVDFGDLLFVLGGWGVCG